MTAGGADRPSATGERGTDRPSATGKRDRQPAGAGVEVELAALSWPLVDGSRTVLVPVGSCEQHGPHLPLDTDTRIAGAVARLAAEQIGAVVAPPIGYGASGEHEAFPGTVSWGADALRAVLVEYGRSAGRWARRVVFVNGHGGNVCALRAAVDLLRHEGRDARWWGCALPAAAGFVRDAHAGRTETSLLLALAPERVRRERAERGNTAALAELMPALRAGGVASVSRNGVLGDPSGASAEEGRRMLAALVDELCRFLG